MAVTVAQRGFVETNTFSDLDVDATPEEIKTSSSTMFSIVADNSNNTVKVYIKIYNVSSSPTVGTTAPNYVIPIAAGAVLRHAFNGGKGVTMDTGIFVACVTSDGTSGSTAPTNAVTAEIKTS